MTDTKAHDISAEFQSLVTGYKTVHAPVFFTERVLVNAQITHRRVGTFRWFITAMAAILLVLLVVPVWRDSTTTHSGVFELSALSHANEWLAQHPVQTVPVLNIMTTSDDSMSLITQLPDVSLSPSLTQSRRTL